MSGKILHLTLKRKWFDLIASGKKREEYREIKNYWAARFLNVKRNEGLEASEWEEVICDLNNPTRRHNSVSQLLDYFGVYLKSFDVVEFKNGYSNSAPKMIVEFNGIEVKQGAEKWGAEAGKYYFTILLGKVLEIKQRG